MFGLVLVTLAAAAAWAACGGNGDGLSLNVTVEPGRISCDALRQFDAYRYKTEVVLDLKERDPSLEPTDGYPPEGFKLTQVVEGAVEKVGKIQVTIDNVEFQQPKTSFIVIGDTVWFFIADQWQSKSVSELGYFPIPYLPLDTCDAIAPDIDVSGMTGQPEKVGDIPSRKYHFDALRSDLPDRHPSMTAESDAARIVNEYQGDIWIADEGSYISKMDISGTGSYENGRPLTVRFFLELSTINDSSIQIKPPV